MTASDERFPTPRSIGKGRKKVIALTRSAGRVRGEEVPVSCSEVR